MDFVNGNHVLRDIEVQHGLLVERAEGIYSFSHLTIQEFLTAIQIDYNNISLEKLVEEHLCDQRWREVFLLLAGLRKADNLLLAMEEAIYSLVDTPKLQNLLFWVERVADNSAGNFQPIGKRAIAIAHAFVNAYPRAFGSSYGQFFGKVNNGAINIAKTFADDIANDTANNFRELKKVYNSAIGIAVCNKALHANDSALDRFIEYAQWSERFQIYRDVVNYDQLINDLTTLRQQIKVSRVFGKKIIQTWQEAFLLTSEVVDLSKSEIEALDNYLYANLLMVECKRAAVRVSRETWSGIESRMLLPVRNNRKKVHYSQKLKSLILKTFDGRFAQFVEKNLFFSTE